MSAVVVDLGVGAVMATTVARGRMPRAARGKQLDVRRSPFPEKKTPRSAAGELHTSAGTGCWSGTPGASTSAESLDSRCGLQIGGLECRRWVALARCRRCRPSRRRRRRRLTARWAVEPGARRGRNGELLAGEVGDGNHQRVSGVESPLARDTTDMIPEAITMRSVPALLLEVMMSAAPS